MKKALLGRRLFASLMPAAPAAAVEIGRGVADTLTSHHNKTFNYVDGIDIRETAKMYEPPATYAKYREAENTLWKARNFRYIRNELAGAARHLDTNIMALKSVSPQHKAIMHMKQEEQEVERNRTFLEQLQDALGLREYFKKRVDLEGSQVATGGR